ncbi:hypothetical protein OG259_01980 [Streptomyces sp. NBC_00250]|uniref:hypothetical protein n=1 Tax=Streptomyces sp. NBC_00250 TaxID=2903641 RepID=UPI002E2AFDF8|nr:hypothetical protein [Streptomyces sp. NBC_00250]
MGEHLREDLAEPGAVFGRRLDDGLDFGPVRPKALQLLGIKRNAEDVASQDGFAHTSGEEPSASR